SLAATAAGHGTLGAVVMGLEGEDPESVDPVAGLARVARIEEKGGLRLDGRLPIGLRPSSIVLHPLTFLPQHSNGMTFIALDADGEELRRRAMFSVGGGFVVDEDDMDRSIAEVAAEGEGRAVFTTGDELLRVCEDRGIPVSEAMLLRERQWRSDEEIREGLLRIWRAMHDCIERGTHSGGVLPGGLEVKRRASSWYDALSAEDPVRLPMNAFAWVSLAALAVNEETAAGGPVRVPSGAFDWPPRAALAAHGENAAGGRVATAPTNGAAGITPAVLHFATTYIDAVDPDEIAVRFLLTAGAIGSLYKEHASI